jgi:hypothetical protein
MVRTAVATVELPVFGVVWGSHHEPLTDYRDLGEASEVARILKGTVMVHWPGSPWVAL